MFGSFRVSALDFVLCGMADAVTENADQRRRAKQYER